MLRPRNLSATITHLRFMESFATRARGQLWHYNHTQRGTGYERAWEREISQGGRNVKVTMQGNMQKYHQDFPGGSDGEASAYNAGGPGSNAWVGKISWRRKWHPTPALLPGKSHGRRSLVGYSPRGRKESDTTEISLSLFFHAEVITHMNL